MIIDIPAHLTDEPKNLLRLSDLSFDVTLDDLDDVYFIEHDGRVWEVIGMFLNREHQNGPDGKVVSKYLSFDVVSPYSSDGATVSVTLTP